MALTIVYETHSTTLDNEMGIATGWLPGELSERGRAEAVELGVRRRDVDLVYVSDLRKGRPDGGDRVRGRQGGQGRPAAQGV